MEDSISDTSSSSGSVERVSTNILVAVVLLLFMVIVIVFFIVLYARWNRHRRAAATDQTHPTRRFVFNFASTPDPVDKGLEPSLLRDIPVLIFHPDQFKDGIECAVCLSELKEGDRARLLPVCNHGFHVECIDMWFQSHSTCPLCRTTVGESSPQFEYLQNDSASGCSIEQGNFRTNASSLSNSRNKTPGQPIETCSSSSSCSILNVQNASPEGSLVIKIPSRTPKDEFNSLSPSTPASRFSEDGMRSPMTTQLRTLRRLLTREKRVVPSSPGFVDVEQGGGGGGGGAIQSSIPITETTT